MSAPMRSTSTMPTARSPLCALVRPRFRARSRTAMSIRQIPLSAASLSRAEDASAPPTRAGFAAFCLFASWTTETYSHVDRLWSITPAVYACMYALLSGWDPRCTLMALLTVMWGWRLTFNFARKGGYNEGEQDYRWPILRAHPLLRHPLVWQVFNFGFIASYQNLLLLLISSPSSAAYRARALRSTRSTQSPPPPCASSSPSRPWRISNSGTSSRANATSPGSRARAGTR